MRLATEKKQMLFMALLISGIVGVIYWRVIFLPFVSDDWWFLRQIQSQGITDSLRRSFNPNGKTVYAPLGEAFMVLVYKTFGFNPVPMRFPNLLIHIVNSCLVVFIINHVLDNKWTGYLAGIVYASAIAVHLDIFAWAWAAYGDVGGTFFFFLSIWLYLNNKTWPSALSYLVGCLFKPTIIFLPGLLFLHSLILAGGKKMDIHPFRLLVKWLPFLIFGGVLVGLKLRGGIPTSYDENHPYYMDFWGKHLITNAQWYLAWMFQSIFPFASLKSIVYKAAVGISTLVILVGSLTALSSTKQDKAFFRIFFLFAWLVTGLFTVYFLPNHTYRYYSIYALPAFVALFFYCVQYLTQRLKLGSGILVAIISFVGLFSVGGSIYQSARIFEEKLNQNTFADGTNMLIRRAATVALVMEKLQNDFPTMSSGSVIVLENADLGAFSNDSALHYIYNDDTLGFYSPSAISYENGDWHLLTPDSDPLYLDPSLLVVYELKEDMVVRLSLADLLKPSIEP